MAGARIHNDSRPGVSTGARTGDLYARPPHGLSTQLGQGSIVPPCRAVRLSSSLTQLRARSTRSLRQFCAEGCSTRTLSAAFICSNPPSVFVSVLLTNPTRKPLKRSD